MVKIFNKASAVERVVAKIDKATKVFRDALVELESAEDEIKQEEDVLAAEKLKIEETQILLIGLSTKNQNTISKLKNILN